MFGDLIESIHNADRVSEVVYGGLDPLYNLKQLFIMRVDNSSSDTDLPASKGCAYSIVDNSGRPLFNANLEYNKHSRRCCKDLRGFEINITNAKSHREVLLIKRPYRLDCCFCYCVSQKLEVHSTLENELIGIIEQDWSICRPRFSIRIPSGEVLFRLLGSCCTMRCCVREVNFPVYTNNDWVKVALISPQWTGLLRSDYEETEFFGVEFMQELDSNMKALILGACFLANGLYYGE